jgi:hypothetical protein
VPIPIRLFFEFFIRFDVCLQPHQRLVPLNRNQLQLPLRFAQLLAVEFPELLTAVA